MISKTAVIKNITKCIREKLTTKMHKNLQESRTSLEMSYYDSYTAYLL